MKRVVCFLSLILFVSIIACSPVTEKPKETPQPVQEKKFDILDSLGTKSFIATNVSYLFKPILFGEKLLFNTHNSLVLSDIATGGSVWKNDKFQINRDYFFSNKHLFSASILDIETGKIKIDCNKELVTICNNRNTLIANSNIALVIDDDTSVINILDYNKGKVLKKLSLENYFYRGYNDISNIYYNNGIVFYLFELQWGKPDGMPDLQYFGHNYNAIIVININNLNLSFSSICYDYELVNDKLVVNNGPKITCFDLLGDRISWEIATGNEEREYRNLIYGSYKTNIFAPLKEGLASIDINTGKINWIYKIDDPEYWTSRGVITSSMLRVKLDTGFYLIESEYRPIRNFHYFHDCTIDLNTGKLVDKQLVKDDTGKNIILIDYQKKFDNIGIAIKGSISTTDQKKTHLVVSFSDGSSMQDFTYSTLESFPIGLLSFTEINGSTYAYRSVYDMYGNVVDDIMKEQGNYCVYSSSDCYKLEFSKVKEVRSIEIPGCHDDRNKMYEIGEGTLLDLSSYGEVSKKINGVEEWRTEIEEMEFFSIPYHDGKNIWLTCLNGIAFIDIKSGKATQLENCTLTKDVDVANTNDVIEYIAMVKEYDLSLYKLYAPLKSLKLHKNYNIKTKR